MSVSIGLPQKESGWLAHYTFKSMRILLAGFGLVLMWLGLMKVVEFSQFADAVTAQGLLPESSVKMLGVVLVTLEVFLGAYAIWTAMGSPRRCAYGAIGVTLLLLGFTGYASVLSFFPPPVPVPCGCTGMSAPVESWVPIMKRNAWLTTGASGMVLGFLKLHGHTAAACPNHGDPVLV